MKKTLLTAISSFLMFSLFLTGCNLGTDDHLFQVLVSNESDLALTDQLVELDLALLEKSIPDSVLVNMD